MLPLGWSLSKPTVVGQVDQHRRPGQHMLPHPVRKRVLITDHRRHRRFPFPHRKLNSLRARGKTGTNRGKIFHERQGLFEGDVFAKHHKPAFPVNQRRAVIHRHERRAVVKPILPGVGIPLEVINAKDQRRVRLLQ